MGCLYFCGILDKREGTDIHGCLPSFLHFLLGETDEDADFPLLKDIPNTRNHPSQSLTARYLATTEMAFYLLFLLFTLCLQVSKLPWTYFHVMIFSVPGCYQLRLYQAKPRIGGIALTYSSASQPNI